MFYHFYEMHLLTKTGGLHGGKIGGLQNMSCDIGNPWTAGLLLIMFAYYVVYYILILRNQKQRCSN
jgi:hypothetical protein